MKILYIAHERQSAQVAAQALRRMLPEVRLTWADTAAAALAWMGGNRDAAAVIVDAEVLKRGGATFIEQVRDAAASAGVLVIGLEQLHGMSVVFHDTVARQQAQHESALARATRLSTGLQERMLEFEAEIQSITARHAAQKAANDQLARRETELSRALTELGVVRSALEQKLAAAEAARQHAVEHAAGELAAADERLATIQNRLDREIALRAGLEEQLAAATRARDDAGKRHEAELSALSARLAERDAQHGVALARSSRICTALQERLLELEHASRARDEREAADAAAIQSLSARERALQVAVDEARAARTAIADSLSDAELRCQRVATELASAADRCGALEQQINEHTTTSSILEQRLEAANATRQEAAHRHAAELAALTAHAGELEAKYKAEAARSEQLERQLQHIVGSLESTRIEWQLEAAAWNEQRARHETEARAALAELAGARQAAERRAAEAQGELERARQRAAADGAAAAERHTALEQRVADEFAARTLLEARLAAAERSRNELEARLARHDAAHRALQARADALRRHAAQVPALQLQLEKSHKENRRQFEGAPYGLFECAPDGSITRINHTLARLLGYRAGADLDAAAFVATAFETPTDLQWLLERTRETGQPEAIETTLRSRDRRSVAVRLHADARQGAVTVAVADLTKLHEVEQKLREAQRLEAVGRVASEVAATCDTLLSEVSHEGRQWLAALDSDTRLRQQGELLLGDVTRAAGFLRQFVAYGHQQISNVSPVNLPRLLREMAPILKRVLGDEIRLMLPRTTDRFDIDVDAERVERILVNVANWARQRMPHGGRVKIQLATTVLDQKFVATHPKVRPGTHVVITITETQGAVWPALPVRLPSARTPPAAVLAPAHNPGMDLGPLLAIIGDAGGHLWMSAEPAGNVTLQIHLPKRTQADAMSPAMRQSAANRGRQLARWFRH